MRAGDPDAYAELVRAHTGIALRAARALGAGADAEDVVQQAFFKAYCSLGRFRDGSAFRPWLLSIVANETRNTVRTAGCQRSLADREATFAEAEPLIPASADPAVAASAMVRLLAPAGSALEGSREKAPDRRTGGHLGRSGRRHGHRDVAEP